MANSTTMTFLDIDGNQYSFVPVPIMSIERNTRRTKKQHLGFDFTATLNGTLFSYDPEDSGTTPSLVNAKIAMDDMRTALNGKCGDLEVKCDDTIVFKAAVRINTLTFSESDNNWINTIPYTIQLSYIFDDTNESIDHDTERIEELSESWEFEFIQEHKYFNLDLSGLSNQDAGSEYTATDSNNPFEARVSHSVNVVGKDICIGTGVGLTGTTGDFTDTPGATAVDHALYYLQKHYDLNYNPSNWGHAISGLNNLGSGEGVYNLYDHFRSHVIDPHKGSVDFRQSWLVVGANTGVPSDALGAREDFTVNFNKSLTDNVYKISVEGTIQGFEQRDYSTLQAPLVVQTGAYTNAQARFNAVKDRFFPRAQTIFQANTSSVSPLNPVPSSTSYGHSHSKGSITYNVEYDNRPCSFISGSLSESISIIDNHPADVFAKLTVLGRAAGPVLQEISTFTEATREITVEATMPAATGCDFSDLETYRPSAQITGLICQFETQLTDANDQVFKNSDNENWNPLTGRYSRSVSWTYSKCAGSGVTSFC